MTIEMIPLNQLTPSQSNVRKTNVAAGIEELAASIEAHGLLQNLTVRAAPKGKFEVVAGGRRLAALTILRRQKKLAKDFPVPCHVIGDADAGEVSLAENVVRLAMHPADQFIAFKALADQGMGIEDIAGRFGATPAIVRQRLKLASVSPVLIGVYREGDMTLDQLMAFTVSDDPAAQEAAWFDSPAFRRDPRSIRGILTEAQVEADDRRVRFLGLEAYLAAGGGMNRDLFQPEHEGYLTNPALLDRLVNEKLESAASDLRAEGWAWVNIMPQISLADFGRLRPTRQTLDEDKFQQVKDLTAELDALVSTYGEDPEEQEIAEQMRTLWDDIEAIEATAYQWSAKDIARSGAIVALNYNGELLVERGLLRAEDMRRQRDDDSEPEGEDSAPSPKASGLSGALTESLTAERTAALRATMMDNQQVALASLAFALATPLFYRFTTHRASCVKIDLTNRNLVAESDIVAGSRAGLLLAERHAAWATRLPESHFELTEWMLAQDMPTLLDLITYCTAQSLDAVCASRDISHAAHMTHADILAAAVGLDMRDWWSPTTDNYLGRVPKTLALEAVREGVSPQAADNLATLKKDRLAQSAEQRLAGTGWLPALLRAPVIADAETEEAEAESDYRQAA